MTSTRAGGKFVYDGDEKLYLRGVTYGTFRGGGFPPEHVVAADFAAMAACGVNTVRTYTVPEAPLLDLAGANGLKLLVGIPWEHHVAFMDERHRRRSIERRVRAAVQSTAAHPAVLGYVVGNEIPPGIVRWHGRQRIERFIERLYRAAKAEHPDALVTYSNYPSTEYLHLPFLDLVCFNVFIEDEARLTPYLARLQTIAGDRPLVISELGLDSAHHGLATQAESVATQLRAAFAAGCAGCFVFAWTDEWNRGGHEVTDWDFGLVDRAHEPKPALEAVRTTFNQVPFKNGDNWPTVSVVVCTYNGARTIAECVRALLELDYPHYEVIVVDDGSSDGAGVVAAEQGAHVRVIRTANRGLSAARNTGIRASQAEIVAFCDDDCRPDRHWLRYLVRSLVTSAHAGVGGPNVPPAEALVADSVGQAPGGPMHVLVSDAEAEHIPGCNMAFRRDALERVGGFDPQFRVAGDDVDLCWRIRDARMTIGFSPGALVWHRARRTIGSYLRQQAGYGRAEALLERKWPERYNGGGHLRWSGTVYGGKVRRSLGRRSWRVYHGVCADGLFQSVYGGSTGGRPAFPLAPEWYLLVLSLAALSACELLGRPATRALPFGVPVSLLLLLACVCAIATRAVAWTAAVVLPPSTTRRRTLAIRGLTFGLCILQPLARLWGRAQRGLTPWRVRGRKTVVLPRAKTVTVWSEHWTRGEVWVRRVEAQLRPTVAQVVRGGDFDTWDLELRLGPLATGRVRVAVEEHGHGRQLVRFRIWPRWSVTAASAGALLAALAALAAAQHAGALAVALAATSAWLGSRMLVQAAAAIGPAAQAAASLAQPSSAPQAIRHEPPPAPTVVPRRAKPHLVLDREPERERV